ncbi:MAG: hypothetical protein EAZ66_04330, partial [Alphaproteobacteria bacterium]
GLINFSEFSLNTTNPIYTPQDYGGISTGANVSFGGFFQGQSLGTAQTCTPGAALTGCIQGNPTGNLALDANSPETFIVRDIDTPTSPVLSGYPMFNGVISILFSENIAAVGLTGGYFNSIGATAITAFGRDGSRLGSVSNTVLGIEFLGLVSGDGSNIIAGLQFSLIGPEPAGFAIDNLRFGRTSQIDFPLPTPSPTATPTPLPTPTNSPSPSPQPSETPPPDISESSGAQEMPTVPVSPLDWGLLVGLGVLGYMGQFWQRK